MFDKIGTFLFVVFVGLVVKAGNPLVVDASVEQLNIKEYAYHFEDTTNSYSFPEITQVTWTKLKGSVSFPSNKHPQWFQYEFKNDSDKAIRRVLFIPYHMIHEVDVYTTVASKLVESSKTGTRRDFSEKDYTSSGYPIDINLEAQKTTTVYVKLKYLYRPLRGATYLMTQQRINEILSNTEKVIWGWRGIFLFGLLISLTLFWFLRLKLFLYYFFLNVGVILFIASQIGDYFYFVTIDSNDFTTLIDYSGAFLISMFFPLFLNALTPSIKERNSIVWKWMYRLIYGIGFFVVLSMFPWLRMSKLMYYAHFYIMITVGLMFVLQLIMLFRCVLKKDENALVLFSVYAFYIAAAFSGAILPNTGVIEDSPYIHNALLIGSGIEIFSFMFLIARETMKIFKDRALLLVKQKKHQKEIAFSIVKGQEEERNRVGRELHDLVGANMAIIKKEIDTKEVKLYNVVERTIDAVRNLSHGLVTPKVKDNEFEDELKEMCHLITTDTLETHIIFHNWPHINSPEITTHLYRVTQELLHNASKHSQAKNVYLQFVLDDQKVFRLIYEDDGIGFDIKKINVGLGLQNIKNRVGLINGNLDIDSGKNGTSVIVEFE